MSNTYSFIDVAATLVGPTGTLDLGYGSAVADEGLTMTMKDNKNVLLMGADGSGMHSLNASRAGIVTLRYLKISPLNAKLMAMYDAQSLIASLWGQNVIVVRQVASGDITTAQQCAFQKRPDLHYKKDGDIVEWIFDAIQMDSILGTY